MLAGLAPALAQQTNILPGYVQGTIGESPAPADDTDMNRSDSFGCPASLCYCMGSDRPCADMSLVNTNLSDDQQEKLYQLKRENISKIAPKMTEMMLAKMDLMEMLSRPNLDKAQVTTLQNKINQLHSDIGTARINYLVDSLAVITPEQRQDIRRTFLKCQPMRSQHRDMHSKKMECPHMSH